MAVRRRHFGRARAAHEAREAQKAEPKPKRKRGRQAPYLFRLGEPNPPTGGRMVERETLPARPPVTDEGDELEVVWYPHRDAQSLLDDKGHEQQSLDPRDARGVTHVDGQETPFSWQG